MYLNNAGFANLRTKELDGPYGPSQHQRVKSIPSLFDDVFLKDKLNSSLNMTLFLKMKLFIKTQQAKGNLADNDFHNILRLFDILPNFPFTTSQTIRDYYL